MKSRKRRLQRARRKNRGFKVVTEFYPDDDKPKTDFMLTCICYQIDIRPQYQYTMNDKMGYRK